MLRRIFLFASLAIAAQTALAQDNGLFGPGASLEKKGFIIGANAGFDMPFGDMADRFGNSFRVGPSLLYKTASNWVFGIKADFIFADKVKEDSLMWNIRGDDGGFINRDGERINVIITERGYDVGLMAGRIFPFGKKGDVQQGVLALTGIGFIQHKIGINNKNSEVATLSNDKKYGYDRLVNGGYLEQFIGYNYLGSGGLINFYVGLNALVGFTAGRRDWQYDLMKPANDKRLDVLLGIRLGIYVPLFKSKADDVYFQ